MSLRFDINGITNEILDKLQKELNYAFDIWEVEVYQHLKHPYFGEDIRPEVGHYFKREANIISGFLQANTYVLADSYGTGSLMLTENPGFRKYLANKKGNTGWNPARRGKTIVGRPKGTYVDIFGRTHTTTGAFEGKPIEGMKVNSSNKTKNGRTITGYYIAPTHPSYAIQIAEKWLYQQYLPAAYKSAVKNINFCKYLKER